MKMNTKEERVGSYKGDKPTYLHKPFLFLLSLSNLFLEEYLIYVLITILNQASFSN